MRAYYLKVFFTRNCRVRRNYGWGSSEDMFFHPSDKMSPSFANISMGSMSAGKFVYNIGLKKLRNFIFVLEKTTSFHCAEHRDELNIWWSYFVINFLNVILNDMTVWFFIIWNFPINLFWYFIFDILFLNLLLNSCFN